MKTPDKFTVTKTFRERLVGGLIPFRGTMDGGTTEYVETLCEHLDINE